MADSTIDFSARQEQPWTSRPVPQFDGAAMARTRALLAEGRLPAPAEDDRALARMMGIMVVAGLTITGGAITGLVLLLT